MDVESSMVYFWRISVEGDAGEENTEVWSKDITVAGKQVQASLMEPREGSGTSDGCQKIRLTQRGRKLCSRKPCNGWGFGTIYV